MDRGAWWAIVHRVTKSQSYLKQLSTQGTTAVILKVKHRVTHMTQQFLSRGLKTPPHKIYTQKFIAVLFIINN